MTDWEQIRARFPAVAECVYLNTAAGAPISAAASAAGREYYEATLRDGDLHWDEWLDRVEQVRVAAAGLLGASAREIGFVNNASAGLNLAAGMLRDRGGVLAVRDDFPSVTLPWLQLGYEVTFVDPGPFGGATLESLEAAAKPGIGILALGLVHYRSGYRYDVGELAALCREHDLILVLDATQCLGALSVDLSATPVDYLVSSGYKWLTAGYGIGLLYVNERHLDSRRFPAVGWRSARDPYALVADRLDLEESATALELGHPPFAGVFSLGAALDLFAEVGVEATERRVLDLSAYLVGRLDDAGFELAVSDQEVHRSGIVSVPVVDPQGIANALASAGILVSARGEGVRVSTHLFNERRDIDRFTAALREAQTHRTLTTAR